MKTMTDPDGIAYMNGENRDDGFTGCFLGVYIVSIGILLLYLFFSIISGKSSKDTTPDTNRCRTYYQGDELIEECN